MLEATLVAMGWAVSNWLIAGVRPTPMGNENMSAAPSGAFRTGRGLLNIAANQQEQFESLCRLVGRAELIADPRFAGREDRKLNRYELKTELEQALAAQDRRRMGAGAQRRRRPGRRGALGARRCSSIRRSASAG